MPEISWYKKVGQLFIEQGFITSEQLEEALEEQRLTGQKIGEILVNKGWLTSEEVKKVLEKQTGVKNIDLSMHIIDPELIKIIPEEMAIKYRLIPVLKSENKIVVAMADPSNVFVIDELERQTNCLIEPVLANEMDIRRAQDQYYGTSNVLQEIIASIDKNKLTEGDSLGEEAPIIKIVNILITRAVEMRASDIHIEPEEKFLGVRYRIDGILYRQRPLPKELQPAVTSRLKIMANLDIAEKRIPQDGRMVMKISDKKIDFRVSTCPVVFGENVVMRILDKSGLVLGLENLGFSPEELKRFEHLISQPYGIILVTGPTGSGKTTTLYSALEKLNKADVNIMTVEDPVEYQFSSIRQVQVNFKAGLNFATALRSFLRQDPDIIMVGEIRDLETAEIAVQAALTGHLVLSTLHTNDAPSAFTRLIDMGVEPFLVFSSLLGVLAQRLVRKVCEKCREQYVPSDEVLKDLGVEETIDASIKFSRGKGCRFCNQSGYRGRVAIYELLTNSPAVQELVLKKSSANEIREIARKEGMTLLREAAIEKLLSGVTTVEEVARVTQSIEM
ncbi:MAG: type II secretion system protein GspE [Candidatus Omnitrophica bacterium 4484_213]|nr:MAG: type II secretion system protein GspE [Candidatus Omnitrophica bacterium 4484_213]